VTIDALLLLIHRWAYRRSHGLAEPDQVHRNVRSGLQRLDAQPLRRESANARR
jgi:hypothetical protein